MINQSYTEGFKSMAVLKLTSPGSLGLNATARELGIPAPTLFGWRKKYANSCIIMSETKKRGDNLLPEEKLQILLETSSLSEKELGEYLRKKGLYSSDLEEWKNNFYNSQKSVGRPKKDPDVQELRKEKKELTREIRRKDKALAEMSARIVLLKKSHLIFGGTEDEE